MNAYLRFPGIDCNNCLPRADGTWSRHCADMRVTATSLGKLSKESNLIIARQHGYTGEGATETEVVSWMLENRQGKAMYREYWLVHDNSFPYTGYVIFTECEMVPEHFSLKLEEDGDYSILDDVDFIERVLEVKGLLNG